MDLIARKKILLSVSLGLPYLEKQKSGQWMATFHETKYMGLSFFLIKIGKLKFSSRPFFEEGDQLIQKKGVISKKKKGDHLVGCTFCVIFGRNRH